MPQVPQFSGSLPRLWQVPEQSLCPDGQTQAVPTHDLPPEQALPHAPQCESLLLSGVSQPSALVQSPKPLSQVYPHWPEAQVALATLACAEQSALHAPQWAALVCVFTSQPFDALPSQFANPLSHAIEQLPSVHDGVPLVASQL